MGIALSKKYSVQPEEAPTMIQAFNDEDNKIEDDRLGTPPENIVTFFNDKVEVIKDPETKGWKAARSQKNKGKYELSNEFILYINLMNDFFFSEQYKQFLTQCFFI
mmetsp:Transcript_53331/g.68444  ORF Transcript_53331/g.68444 Transcript_53331/m.68444 type:complete len:106 (-) Transcript_53331:732-1049(-)